METKGKKLDFTGQTVFVGFDVHKNTWRVSTCTKNVGPGRWTIPVEYPFVKNITKYLHKHFPNADFVCGYEAGYSGFWIQEELEKNGFTTKVLNAADIPTNDKQRRQKEDKRDARKIAKALKNGDVDSIYIPSKQAQRDRSLVRERSRIVQCVGRVQRQIKSHLAFYNIRIPEELSGSHWTQRFDKWLEAQADQREDQTLAISLNRYKRLKEVRRQANRKLTQLARSERHCALYEWLRSAPGIGKYTALILITEIIDMTRFSNGDKVCSYVGLIPTTSSSGDKEVQGSLTKRSNGRVKTALIESSWIAIGVDRELRLKYEELRKRGKSSQEAIIYIARTLLKRIRSIWLKGEKYKATEV